MVRLVVAADNGAGDAVKVLLSHAGYSPSAVLHLLHHLRVQEEAETQAGNKRRDDRGMR